MHKIEFLLLPAWVRAVVCAAAVAAVALPGRAVETKFWQQQDFSDFEKGNLNKISIRSDGRLFLAPALTEVLDSSAPYLWALALDASGNIYAGGGGPTGSTSKLFRIAPDGKWTTLAELPGLEIHAIAVDRKGVVYAATAPDGKVYRVANGKSEIFFDPHTKYIWALAFSPENDLYIATGDRGEVYKVTPQGKGAVFFQTEETHARSLAVDRVGNLIIGTEPNGVIMRVTPQGQGFVLYETPKREITAVAVAQNGSIYAAAVGARAAGVLAAPPAPSSQQPSAPPPTMAPTPPGGRQPQPTSRTEAAPPPPSLSPSPAAISGGSEVYRIDPDGSPHKVWTHGQEIAYAIAFDNSGRPLVGTGNKGNIYRLDSDLRYTLLLNLPPTQVTGFAAGPGGAIYAATGNVGKVYRLGPASERQGSFESDTFDGGAFTYWGRLSFVGARNGGGIAFEARSGNVSHPQKNWSPWTPVTVSGDGGRIAAPPARFLQYRITFTASPNGRSPEVSAIDIAYLNKNLAPLIENIEITPANYRFSPSVVSTLTSTTGRSITLPPLGGRRPPPLAPLAEISSQTMQYAKGYQGARWLARDDNGDTLKYKVEIRGVGESEWKTLKDEVHERSISFDSTGFADGKYMLRIIASDSPSNPPDQALSASLESDLFLIDNTPPEIVGLAATASANGIEVGWMAKDALSVVSKAEYSVDGGEWTVVDPITKLSDSSEEEYRLHLPRTHAGECTIAIRVTDEYDNQTVQKTIVR
jgi:sugar lactone lactonase YvrE